MSRALLPLGFEPALAAVIDGFETRFDIRFRPDYRAFLQSVNGADLGWYQDPAWNKTAGFYDEFGMLETRIRAEHGADWAGAACIFGLGNGHPRADLLTNGEIGFYHPDLLRHLYLVAVDGGGNTFVQAAAGGEAGRVFSVDHETCCGLHAYAEPEEAGDPLPWADLRRASTDAVISRAVEDGFIIPVVESFETFFARETAVAHDLADALAPRYLKR